jgi:hypothetical protein
MVARNVEICNMALIGIGAQTIQSFDDTSAEARAAAALYPMVRDQVLSSHPWEFAVATRALDPLAVAPIADFQYAFQVPPDALRLLAVGIAAQSAGIRYERYSQQILCDYDAILLRYISRPPEDMFPVYFVPALVAALAADFVIPLTESTSRYETLVKAADLKLRMARLIDSQSSSSAALQDFSLIDVR